MTREDVIAALQAHKSELKEAGLLHVSIFGSVARGEAGPNSDVDLMASFDKTKRLSLLHMVGLENRLSDILGVPVDLAPQDMLKEPVKRTAEREAVLVF